MQILALLISKNQKLFSEISYDFAKNFIKVGLITNKNEFKSALKENFDVILITHSDVDITGCQSIEHFCNYMKESSRGKIVYVLAENLNEKEIISIINSGADEVSIAPWNFIVIAKQIINLFSLKKVKGSPYKLRKKIALNDGAIKIDIPARKCFIQDINSKKDIQIKLTRLEFSILTLLISKKGEMVSYQEFKEEIWKNKIFPKEIKATLLQHITDLKKKLGIYALRIKNIWGEGFRIE